MQRYLIIVLGIFYFSELCSAKSWQVTPPIINPVELKRLEDEYRDLKTPEQVTQLLKSLNSLGEFDEVTVVETEDQYIFSINPALKIQNIEITSSNTSIERSLASILQSTISKSYNEDLKTRVETDLSAHLRDLGYFQTKISFQTKKIDDFNLVLYIYINTGEPCLIRGITFSFDLPKNIPLKLTPGEICNKESINRAFTKIGDKLREQGYNQQNLQSPNLNYDDATNSAIIEINGSIGQKITYDVKSPVHKNIFLKFFFGDELNEANDNPSSPQAIRSSLARNYKNQGYDDVVISEADINRVNNSTLNYRFEVKPGPQYRIIQVEFEGMSIYTKSEAIEIMDLAQTLQNQTIFTQEKIRQAMQLLKNGYAQNGYWDVNIGLPQVSKDPENGSVVVRFNITEGRRRVLESIRIEGASLLTMDIIQNFFDTKIGDSLVWDQILLLEDKIKSFYTDRGYLYIKLNLELQQSEGLKDIKTKLLIKVNEGKQVKFGAITVDGLTKTDPSVVLREIYFKTGDIFIPEKIERSRQALLDLGLFSSISLRAKDTSDLTTEKETIDFIISIRDARPGTVTFGPGWSLNEGGRFVIDASYANLNGFGRQIFLRTAISEEKDQANISNSTLLGRNLGLSLSEPYIFDLPLKASFSLDHRAQADTSKWEISRSFETRIAHDYRIEGPRQKSEILTLYKTTKIESDALVCDLIFICRDNVQIRELGFRHEIDARNSISWPTQGFIAELEVAKADYLLGGDTSYDRLSLKNNSYIQIFDDFVLALGLQIDTYQNIERKDGIPDVLASSELLKTGGANTNRGFSENELGPVIKYQKDNGEFENIFPGGSQRFSLRNEVRYQIIENTFAGSFFIDSANSFFTQKEEATISQQIASSGKQSRFENNYYAFEKILTEPSLLWTKNYLSFGVSLSYLTPLGSFNLSYGFPWKRCLISSECVSPRGKSNYRNLTGGQFHINVGANF